MKKNLSYIDSVHRDGRIWNLSVMVLLFAFPVSVACIFGVVPDWGALAMGLIATAPMYWVVGVIETVTYGYAGEITMVIGVNNDGKVTGLVVKEAHETPGLGNNILTDHVFLSQFLNKTGSFEVATSGADAFSGATGTSDAETETYVDGISGATVPSKAIARCVNSAVAYVTGADIDSGATSWGG